MSTVGQESGGVVKTAILVLVAVAILVADQVSKAFVMANLALGERASVLGDLVQVVHAQNRGAAFSLFQGGSLLFIAVSIVSLVMVAYFHRNLRGRAGWVHVVLGVVLGGTLGNFIDRLRQGYVTDWLSVGFGDLRWPTFNVADSSIVVGLTTFVIYLWLTSHDAEEAPA